MSATSAPPKPETAPWAEQLRAAIAAIPRHQATRAFPNRRQPGRRELRGRRRVRRASVVLVAQDLELSPGQEALLSELLAGLSGHRVVRIQDPAWATTRASLDRHTPDLVVLVTATATPPRPPGDVRVVWLLPPGVERPAAFGRALNLRG